ncbi:MAG: hypothetical protein H6581_16575 [Bacteroidia bacterium]|nr:hypothetical protein [Bacteroidia bacterium]
MKNYFSVSLFLLCLMVACEQKPIQNPGNENKDTLRVLVESNDTSRGVAEEYYLCLFQEPCSQCRFLGIPQDHPMSNLFSYKEILLGEIVSFKRKQFDFITTPVGDPDIFLRTDSLLVHTPNHDWAEPLKVSIEWMNESVNFSYLSPSNNGKKAYYGFYHQIELSNGYITHSIFYELIDLISEKKDKGEWLPLSIKIKYEAVDLTSKCTITHLGNTAIVPSL